MLATLKVKPYLMWGAIALVVIVIIYLIWSYTRESENIVPLYTTEKSYVPGVFYNYAAGREPSLGDYDSLSSASSIDGYRVTNQAVHSSKWDLTVGADSIEQCVSICDKEPNCVGFRYDSSTKTASFYTAPLILSNSTTSKEIYIKDSRKNIVFNPVVRANPWANVSVDGYTSYPGGGDQSSDRSTAFNHYLTKSDAATAVANCKKQCDENEQCKSFIVNPNQVSTIDGTFNPAEHSYQCRGYTNTPTSIYNVRYPLLSGFFVKK